MHAETYSPGKFEGNVSQWRAKTVHEAGLEGCDEEAGDCSELGWWAGLLYGRRYAFIVREDDQGFVAVETFENRVEADAAWQDVEEDEREFYATSSDDRENDELAHCPCCQGIGGFLGGLGRLLHFRCVQCGMDFSWTLDARRLCNV